MQKLGDIADIRVGHTFRESLRNDECGNVAVIQAKDIANWDSDSFVRGDFGNLRTFRLSPGDVLFTMRGSFQAKLFSAAEPSAIAASSICIIRIHGEYLPEYVELFLNSEQCQRVIYRLVQGTSIPSLSVRELASLPVPRLSICEQYSLLDSVHAIWQVRNALEYKQELLSKLEQGLLQKAIREAN